MRSKKLTEYAHKILVNLISSGQGLILFHYQ